MSLASPAGPAPTLAVALECARAALGLLAGPWHLGGYLARRGAARAELLRDLEAEPGAYAAAPPAALPARPLRVFVSCAEASGEQHAANLARALRAECADVGAPAPELRGLGGAALAAGGVELVGSPTERASMGFAGALAGLPYYLRLVRACAAQFREWRPDVFVPVDSPSLHVPLARIAGRYGVPTAHFVTPQHWGWAPWRTPAYRRAVARPLSILPFEPAWFHRHGVETWHVGHPILDTFGGIPATTPPPTRRVLALLPGSRAGVIRSNLPWMLALLERVRSELDPCEVRVLQQDAAGASLARELVAAAGQEGRVRVVEGALHDELAQARAALSVSGTVLLDLLHHRLPTVVLYRTSALHAGIGRRLFLTPPWFASTNLLAGRELLPEFGFSGAGEPGRVGAALVRCFVDEDWRADCARGLERAAERLGPPGACQRAARAAIALAVGGAGA